MRHRFVFLAAAAAAAVGLVAGCGDEKAPPKQTVFWLGLNQAAGTSLRCSSTKNFQLPADARATVISTDANGERIKNSSDNLVECDVRLASGSTTDYTVSLRFSGGEVGNFSANGTLTQQGGELEVNFTTADFSLEQTDCTATVETLTPGAVWLRSLRCQNLRDESSPGIQCDGQGGLIFENCDR